MAKPRDEQAAPAARRTTRPAGGATRSQSSAPPADGKRPPARAAKAPEAPKAPAVPTPAPAPQPQAQGPNVAAMDAVSTYLAPALRLLNSLLRPEAPTDLARVGTDLQEPFPIDGVDWKVQSISRDKKSVLMVPYLNNRAVQDRLDTVFGVGGWQNSFREGPCGGVLCGISVRIVQPNGQAEWVTRWDAAENPTTEPVKGGISDSQKRAAVEWGIGRYLYRVPRMWLPCDENGRPTRKPELPPAYLPKRENSNAHRIGISEEREHAEVRFHIAGTRWAGNRKEWDAQRPDVIALYGIAQAPPLALVEYSTGELPWEHLLTLAEALEKRAEKGQRPKKLHTPEGKAYWEAKDAARPPHPAETAPPAQAARPAAERAAEVARQPDPDEDGYGDLAAREMDGEDRGPSLADDFPPFLQ